jgi:hypothetical protein
MNPPLDEFLMSSYGTVLNEKKSWFQIWDEIIIGDSHSDHFVARFANNTCNLLIFVANWDVINKGHDASDHFEGF